MKVIQDAVEGLTSLQGRFPEQVLYKDFRLSHIQVDSENNAKVSGYWFVTSSSQSVQAHVLSSSNNARANAYCAPETRSKGILTWKSTVWSLGITILELLCGKQHKDEQVVKDEKQNLVKWAKPLLLEEAKHFLIMDSKLKGDFEPKDVKVMANIILQCIQRDPGKRPSMKTVLDMLKTTKETKQLRASTWRENSSNKVMGPMSAPLFGLGSSESANSGALDNKRPSYVRSPTMVKFDCARSPPKFDLVQSPALKRLIIPPRSCVE
ncbi:hypothetical protein KP509_34G021300 [Ceratopteris richardii]|nr:hypothetical protein KP509_34G021300 [Ceratopteris richardii]